MILYDMDFRLLLVLLALIVQDSLTAPTNKDLPRRSQRDVEKFLEDTAKSAESFGQKALKYLIPATEKSGLAVLKPFLRKRDAKRSVNLQQQTGFYTWPYNMNNNVRSAFPSRVYNGNSNQGNQLLNNPYRNWVWPVQRSVIPGFMPQQYNQRPQLPGPGPEKRTMNDKEAKAQSETDAKNSLNDFRNLITDVDSALVSYSDKSGVALNENLKGVEASSKKREQIESSKKRSKSPKKLATEELKKITDTFTDFVCGDAC